MAALQTSRAGTGAKKTSLNFETAVAILENVSEVQLVLVQNVQIGYGLDLVICYLGRWFGRLTLFVVFVGFGEENCGCHITC